MPTSLVELDAELQTTDGKNAKEPHIRSATLDQIYDYWQRLGKDGKLPRKEDIIIGDISDILPSIFLIDVDGAGERFSYRLIGTKVAQLTGRDLTGKQIDESTYGDVADFALQVMATVVRSRAPVLVQGSAKWLRADTWREMASLYLPMSSDNERVDIILGAINSDHAVADQPIDNTLVSIADVTVITNPLVSAA